MQGIYSRDQMASLLQTAIENANARRQASVDRENGRTASNAAAAQDFLKSLGREYEQYSAESREDERRKELENIRRLEAELENARKMERSAKELQLRRERRSAEAADAMDGYRPLPSPGGYSRYMDNEREAANPVDVGAMGASYDMAMAMAEAQRKRGLY